MKTRSATIIPSVIVAAFLLFLITYRTIRKNWRAIFRTALGTFLVSLLLSTSLAYASTSALTETRKSALVKTISQSQDENSGFFRIIVPYSGANDFNTANALSIMMMLKATNYINVDEALQYLSGTQYNHGTGVGGFGARFDKGSFIGCDLYSTYCMVKVLSMYNSLDRINETSLVNFIASRYDDTIGAFHELVTEVEGKQYASSTFPMVFRSFMSHIAYAMPNIITTYAGVCALKELGRLDLINATKAFEWVMHCQAGNGMFKPYPDSSYMPMPEWSPVKANPFEVDRYGTGIPYTFAAVGALETLNRTEAISFEDRQRIKAYVISCQGELTGDFAIHQDYDYKQTPFAYEAIMTLYYLSLLEEARDAVTKTENRFQEFQRLDLDNSWPIPYPGYLTPWGLEKLDYYGLHNGLTGPPQDSYYATAIFNTTGHLGLLDQPTPRVQRTWLNLIELSAIITAGIVIALLGILKNQKWRQKIAVEAKPA